MHQEFLQITVAAADDGQVGKCLLYRGRQPEVTIDARTNEPLANAVAAVLTKSRNTGRPPSEWELRRENGVAVDPSRTPAECELKPAAVLYLSLRAGAGGDAPRTRGRETEESA